MDKLNNMYHKLSDIYQSNTTHPQYAKRMNYINKEINQLYFLIEDLYASIKTGSDCEGLDIAIQEDAEFNQMIDDFKPLMCLYQFQKLENFKPNSLT